MNERLEAASRRFARLTTRAVVARPTLWRLFRPLIRTQFERLAPVWEGRRASDSLAPLEAALGRLARDPAHILDVGTGTGQAARLLARRFPAASVTAVDLSPAMVAEARRLLAPELAGRVRIEVADAAALPHADAAFDLVVLLNMIPFFPELARVLVPGGTLVAAFSHGAATPIYVPPATLSARLAPLGFGRFEELLAGAGSAFLAVREEPGYDAGQATSAAR